jgi:potassium-transporting ATPase KdpC subunit
MGLTMLAHLRANLWLLGLTVLLCCVVYPVALWAVGQAALHDRANGSLIHDADGKPIASRLIAHEVKGEQYFQPRPSATGGSPYNATASGASNWAANNYQLRDRVARALAPLVKYGKGPRQGQPVAPDVVAWFRQTPGLVAQWAEAHPGLAQAWAKSEDVTKEYVRDWFKQHPADRQAWAEKNPGKDNPEPEDLAVDFFQAFAREHPRTWLVVVTSKDEKDNKGESVKSVALVGPHAEEGTDDIAAVFFDMWRDAHPDVALEEVPADLVMASASGLDPHITLKNALYQLPRVVDKWAELTGQDKAGLRRDIEALLRRHAHAPLFGLAGVELVNVIEVNLALHTAYAGRVR